MMKIETKLKKWAQSKSWNILYVVRSYWAVAMYSIGKKPACSTLIDEVSITAGYGKLNFNGDFQYDLPSWCVRKLFKGCTKWNDYLEKCANEFYNSITEPLRQELEIELTTNINKQLNYDEN